MEFFHFCFHKFQNKIKKYILKADQLHVGHLFASHMALFLKWLNLVISHSIFEWQLFCDNSIASSSLYNVMGMIKVFHSSSSKYCCCNCRHFPLICLNTRNFFLSHLAMSGMQLTIKKNTVPNWSFSAPVYHSQTHVTIEWRIMHML